eukprot:CAMPEP_0194048694 /NCGR_PEP_ID=MMETSP0009_2-20130614/28144_1 /TAXON_ID=210454 /ORGANISM="Grammatophora oceanica, Strain CCMP 410" /LENGTH=462 /DNA_ID=CAMNT_0038694633 /DNA_START=21 /DNA_END=1409 /DNA_ORIENTATION=+
MLRSSSSSSLVVCGLLVVPIALLASSTNAYWSPRPNISSRTKHHHHRSSSLASASNQHWTTTESSSSPWATLVDDTATSPPEETAEFATMQVGLSSPSQQQLLSNQQRRSFSLDTSDNDDDDTALVLPQQKRQFTPFQQVSRIAPIATMLAYGVKPEPFDHAISQLYAWVYSWDVTHTPLFEAHVAAFSFAFFIAAFSFVHILLGDDEKTKQVRLDGKMPSESALLWSKLSGITEWFNPFVSYLVSIWMYQHIFHTYNEPTMIAPTFGVLIVEVFVGVFLYDLFFCPIHYLMHRSTKLKGLRFIHGYHHRHSSSSSALNSIETVQHSYIDGALQVMVNILVQHISPFGATKHLLSRMIHNVVVTYLLAEAHSGYTSFEWMSHNIWPEFLGGAPRHDRHHQDGRVYYQQYFKYLDDFFGFTDEVRDRDNEQMKEKAKVKKAKAKMQQQQEQQTTSERIPIPTK